MVGRPMGFFSFCRVSGCFSPFFSLTQKRGGPQAAQTADKLFPGGLEGPQALQSGFVSPGFPRSLNRRGGRWPRPPLVSLPRKYRRSARWPRAALVFAHAFRSLWPLRGQVPTGHTLPFGAPSGRFGPFGPKCPGCSIIRASLTVARMVSLPRFGSLCHLRWQQPTGLALPSVPSKVYSYRPASPGGRGVCALGRKHSLHVSPAAPKAQGKRANPGEKGR